MSFKNNPRMTNEQGQEVKTIFRHQPLTFDHYGIQCSIKENGKITIRSLPIPVPGSKDEVEFDEVTIPASLVFKLVTAIQMTRKVTQVPVAQVSPDDEVA
jgi:hypothetical protein